MEFLSPQEFESRRPAFPALLCKRSPWAIGIVFLVFLGGLFVSLYFAITTHSAFYFFAALSGLFLLFYKKPFFAQRKVKTNWLLMDDGDGLWLNLRSFVNFHFPQTRPSLLRILNSEVEWIRLLKERREIPLERGGLQVSRHKILQIKLISSKEHLEKIEKTLLDDVHEKPHGSRSRYIHYPVSFKKEDALLLVDWEATTPSIDKVMQHLAQRFKIVEAEKIDWGSWRNLSPQKTDDLILHLVQFGKTFDAIRLLRVKRKMSLKQAKQFVDELRGAQKS